MRPWIRFILFPAVGLLALFLDHVVMSGLFFSMPPVRFVLIMIIAVTFFSGFWAGIATAVLFGVIHEWVSVLPTGLTILSYLVVVALTSLLTRRFLTSRSLASLFLCGISGTVGYYLAVLLLSLGSRLLDDQAVTLPLGDVVTVTIRQTIVHSILMYGIWRWRNVRREAITISSFGPS